MEVAAPSRLPTIGLIPLFLKFLRFGCLAFGGPVAQIAMLRQALVEEESWIDKGRFNRLLAVLQVLPGPEAHELCVHFGVLARGRIGRYVLAFTSARPVDGGAGALYVLLRRDRRQRPIRVTEGTKR